MINPDLSIVIVNYNVKDYLRQALSAIYQSQGDFAYEVFVVDNASVDGSVSMVKRNFPQVNLIASRKNLGFSGGNNLALKRANGRYVLLLNPDAIVACDTLANMIEFMDENPDVGASGCKILNPDGTFQLNSRRSIPTIKISLAKLLRLDKLFPNSKKFARYNMTYFDPDESRDVEALMGAFFMVRREALEDVGLLDDTFFMYGEDLDWSYRFTKAGWKIWYYPKTTIVHHYRKSSSQKPLQTAYVFHTAMAIFYNKHFASQKPFYVNAAVYWAIAFRMMIFLITASIR